MSQVLEAILQRERTILSPLACLSENSRGRAVSEADDAVRTAFQRDRDRIIHSKAFRRLMHKTQVFLCPEDDHYRTRLTHTVEVSQIARTISRALGLNEDLTEAIALAHDLGHGAFGHAGERVLQRCYSADYAHNRQSVRVAEILEEMNLTYEVLDGIRGHDSDEKFPCTLEGRVVRLSDKIAYINHDLDDAIRAKIISQGDIPLELLNILGQSHSKRIGAMVNSIIKRGVDDGAVQMEEHIHVAAFQMRNFLTENVYTSPIAKGEEGKAERMLERLYEYFVASPNELPSSYVLRIESESVERCVADYVADMTDRYAMNLFGELFVPELWRGYSDR